MKACLTVYSTISLIFLSGAFAQDDLEKTCLDNANSYLAKFEEILLDSNSDAEKEYYSINMNYFKNKLLGYTEEETYKGVTRIFKREGACARASRYGMSSEAFERSMLRNSYNNGENAWLRTMRYEGFFNYVNVGQISPENRQYIPEFAADEICGVRKFETLESACVSLIKRFFYRTDGSAEPVTLIVNPVRFKRTRAEYNSAEHTLTLWVRKKSDRSCEISDPFEFDCYNDRSGSISPRLIREAMSRSAD